MVDANLPPVPEMRHELVPVPVSDVNRAKAFYERIGFGNGERAIMARHAAYWSELVEQRGVVVYGPVVASSGSFGLAVFPAASEDDALALAQADAAVSSGMATFEIGTMPVAVLPD